MGYFVDCTRGARRGSGYAACRSEQRRSRASSPIAPMRACALHDVASSGSVRREARSRAPRDASVEANMLWTIFVVLMVMWLLGMVSSYTLGGFIHLLLVLAIAVVLIDIIRGRRAV
jgi:hypothetical protein